jgi:hypothetical protein
LSPDDRDLDVRAATIARTRAHVTRHEVKPVNASDTGRSDAAQAELARIGVTDVSFELFNATHMAIDYRYPQSLAYLAQRLR